MGRRRTRPIVLIAACSKRAAFLQVEYSLDESTMNPFLASLKEIWSRLTWPDLVSTAVAAGGLLAAIFGFNGGFFSFLKYLAVIAGVYLFFRLICWWRSRLLWSLRNRLILAYLFIAAVPILSIVTLVVLAGRILYSQLGAYLLYEDIHQRINMIADI